MKNVVSYRSTSFDCFLKKNISYISVKTNNNDMIYGDDLYTNLSKNDTMWISKVDFIIILDSMKANHLKHKEDREWYHSYEWEKASYVNFMNRLDLWYSREESIQPWKMKWPKPKNEVSDTGRVCNKCLQFKLWSEFAKAMTMWSPNRRTQDCKQCRNEYKRQYREKSNRDQEYKKLKRKPPIWSKIWLINYIHYDTMWNPREVIWTITDYKYKKWYTLINKKYQLSLKASFWDNKTSWKFYSIEENTIEKEENKKDNNIYFQKLP